MPQSLTKNGRRNGKSDETMGRANAMRSYTAKAARPLNKGYSKIMEMVLSYATDGKIAGTPTLEHSLNRFRFIPTLKNDLAALPRDPLCLIEGYSTPGNAQALQHFVHELNGSDARIETVDLYDLPEMYKLLGFEPPPMRYHIADAAHLDHLYNDNTVDLVVEDFLLNCVPASRHDALIKEVSRVLRPGGVGLISFTSCVGLDVDSAISTDDLLANHDGAWNAEAYDIDEVERTCGLSLHRLVGQIVYHPVGAEFIYIAESGGRFEFFRTRQQMFSRFEAHKLQVASYDVSEGIDDHGLHCIRYRCVLRKES